MPLEFTLVRGDDAVGLALPEGSCRAQMMWHVSPVALGPTMRSTAPCR